MKLLSITVVLAGLTLCIACSKGNNDDNMSPTKKILVAGKWQLSAYTATTSYLGQDTTIDLYSQMDECDKDDFMEFAANGTSTMDENTNKCPGYSQIEHATWALLNNDTKLAIVDSNPDTMDLEITSMEMKMKLTRSNSSGVPIIYKWTHKNIK